ncbi:DUF3253 domain-containing protein [Nodosilinea nodulosa]|uniref:DUF3253 domain-containing protein n=1 Tax=Nodosilinea nodulosa TaxID=416001 RepID=UPI000319105F|nr:DUF3253 domain-containing protein [Nodosilinea nodulosa]
MTVSADTIRATLLSLVAQRGPDKTICPSEVARALSAQAWQDLMPAVREAGIALAAEGCIAVTQKGRVVNPQSAKGPIRYRQAKD